MSDLKDAIFQADCQISQLQDEIEYGGKIAKVEGDIVTIDLPDDTFTEINLRPVQYLLDRLRKLST